MIYEGQISRRLSVELKGGRFFIPTLILISNMLLDLLCESQLVVGHLVISIWEERRKKRTQLQRNALEGVAQRIMRR